MNEKKICFNVSSYNDAAEILNINIVEKKIPVFYIKYYLINGLGIDWLLELKSMLKKNFIKVNFKIFVDIKYN